MRPRERRETGEQDLFRSRLDQIIDMKHSLVTLARTVDWDFLEQAFGAVYTDGPGQPPVPTRLMAGLAILKHTYGLSDEVLCERWVENPITSSSAARSSSSTGWCSIARRRRAGATGWARSGFRPCCRRACRLPSGPRRSNRPSSPG